MKKTNDIKIVFIDIDNTLFDHSLNIFTPSAIKAVNDARKNGVKVFICTARPYSSIKLLGTFDELKLDGYIANSGGLVYCDNNFIVKGNIPEKTVNHVIDIATQNNVCVEICDEKTSFLNIKEDKYAAEFHNKWKQKATNVGTYSGGDINSIIVYGPEQNDALFQSINNEGAKFFRFCSIASDIFEYRYQKSHGVKAVLDYFHLSKKNALAIGDDYQDLEMFNEVDNKVAMGNAVQELKIAATYITSDISDDGVLKAFKHYKII